jgi:hypothetical protein
VNFSHSASCLVVQAFLVYPSECLIGAFSVVLNIKCIIFHLQLQQASIVSMLPSSQDNSQVSVYCQACTFVIP